MGIWDPLFEEKKHCINDEFHDVNRPLEITAFQLPNEFQEDYSEQKVSK